MYIILECVEITVMQRSKQAMRNYVRIRLFCHTSGCPVSPSRLGSLSDKCQGNKEINYWNTIQSRSLLSVVSWSNIT